MQYNIAISGNMSLGSKSLSEAVDKAKYLLAALEEISEIELGVGVELEIETRKLTICVDFDRTLFDSNYPETGTPKPGAAAVMRMWHDTGHTIIINTCRALHTADTAKRALEEYAIPYDYFNANDPKRIREFGVDCRKISADVYVDDRSVFAPDVLDWKDIEQIVAYKCINRRL